jgi:uncharacterized protein (TIGR02246 family)
MMQSSVSKEVHAIYQQLMDAWNNRSAEGMAELFTDEGELIGFDGSEAIGREEIFSHLKPIFVNYPTPPYISKVRKVRSLSSETAILSAVAGMIPPGLSDIDPKLNSHHRLVAVKKDKKWLIELFQNTPAQFHGRPEMVEKMTEELRQLIT